MLAAKIKSKDKQLDRDNVFEAERGLRLLKSVGVYGANAGGKTNLIKAILFMKYFVLSLSQDRHGSQLGDLEVFRLDTMTRDRPSLFEVVFLLSGHRYRYGFEIDKNQVVSEWLFRVPSSREARLFVREGDRFTVSGKFREARRLQAQTRKDVLFLSVLARYNDPVAMEIQGWFEDLDAFLAGLDPFYGWRSYEYMKDDAYRRRVTDFVERLDLGIAAVKIEETPHPVTDAMSELPDYMRKMMWLTSEGKRIRIGTVHHLRNEEGGLTGTETFDLERQESAGTQKLFAMAGLMVDVLSKGSVLVADELDARLHPLITSTIVRMFHSPEANPNNAQLIFTTHDTNLLRPGLLRRDQIWFVEKDEVEASHLHSLVEYRIRNDAIYEKDYLLGKYGAIPLLGGLQSIWEHDDV
ncbi:MAG: ATP-binding protein [Pseudomonadota bacterium]